MAVVHHEVVRGDTLWGIARKYGSTVDAIATANSWLADINLVKPGWVLHVTVRDAEPVPNKPVERITAKLVPPTGKILLGSSVPHGGISGYTDVAGIDPAIVHNYATSPAGFAADVRSTPAGMIPFVNFKPLGVMGKQAYERILRGEADAALDAAAATIVAHGKPLFVAINHEPENDEPAGEADELYARSFRYCVGRLRGKGAGNGVYVWNMMGFPNHGHRYDALFPGKEFVDWIACDPYSHSRDHDSFADFVNKSSGSFPGFYTWAAKHGLPIMLAEWGIDNEVRPVVAPKVLSQAGVDGLLAEMPLIKALVYWDQWKKPQSTQRENYLLKNMAAQWRDFCRLPNFQVDLTPVT